jgi:hypothetical protein
MWKKPATDLTGYLTFLRANFSRVKLFTHLTWMHTPFTVYQTERGSLASRYKYNRKPTPRHFGSNGTLPAISLTAVFFPPPTFTTTSDQTLPALASSRQGVLPEVHLVPGFALLLVKSRASSTADMSSNIVKNDLDQRQTRPSNESHPTVAMV